MNEEEGRLALAAAVTRDRTRKFRTIERAKTAAEISRGAWEKVERGDRVRPYTLAAVEQALDWPPGRAEDIIEKGEEDAPPTPEAAALEELRQEMAAMRAELQALKDDRRSG